MVILFKYNFYLNKINIHFKNGLTTFFSKICITIYVCILFWIYLKTYLKFLKYVGFSYIRYILNKSDKERHSDTP